jgi:hypothetical protein
LTKPTEIRKVPFDPVGSGKKTTANAQSCRLFERSNTPRREVLCRREAQAGENLEIHFDPDGCLLILMRVGTLNLGPYPETPPTSFLRLVHIH